MGTVLIGPVSVAAAVALESGPRPDPATPQSHPLASWPFFSTPGPPALRDCEPLKHGAVHGLTNGDAEAAGAALLIKDRLPWGGLGLPFPFPSRPVSHPVSRLCAWPLRGTETALGSLCKRCLRERRPVGALQFRCLSPGAVYWPGGVRNVTAPRATRAFSQPSQTNPLTFSLSPSLCVVLVLALGQAPDTSRERTGWPVGPSFPLLSRGRKTPQSRLPFSFSATYALLRLLSPPPHVAKPTHCLRRPFRALEIRHTLGAGSLFCRQV